MKIFDTRAFVLAAAVVGLAAAGCGSSNDSTGKGGSGGSGGRGGSGNAGGSTPTGGTGGTGGTPVVHIVNFTFPPDTMAQNWTKESTYQDPTGMYPNLGFSGEAGASTATVVWDGTVDANGSATSGSIKVTADFSAYNQYIDAVVNYPATMLVNLTGKTAINARIRVDAGTFPGGAMFHISSGPTGSANPYHYVPGTFTAGLQPGTWTPLVLPLPTADPAWDATMVVQIGVQFSAGGAPVDGGAFPSATFSFHIDDVTD